MPVVISRLSHLLRLIQHPHLRGLAVHRDLRHPEAQGAIRHAQRILFLGRHDVTFAVMPGLSLSSRLSTVMTTS